MKKVIILLTLVLLAVYLSIGCTGTNVAATTAAETTAAATTAAATTAAETTAAETTAAETTAAETTAAAGKITIALVPGMTTNPFYYSMYNGAKAAADKLGANLVWQGPADWDYAKQVVIVQALIAKGDINFLLLVACDPKALMPVVHESFDKGIPVICIDGPVEDKSALTFIASDNYEGGMMAGAALAKAINFKGEVAYVASLPGVAPQEARSQGFIDAVSKYPDIKVVAHDFSQTDQAKATAITQAMLIAHPNLVGLFAQDTPTGHGCAIGLQNAGALGKVQLASFDAQPAQVEDLQKGLITMLVAQAPYAMGYIGVDYAYHYLKGFVTKFPETVTTGYKAITAESLKSDPDVNNWIYSNTPPAESK